MDHSTRHAPALRERLAAALPAAMKARDQVAVAALRSTLAALANAEAVGVGTPAGTPAGTPPGSADVAGTTLGLGATEAVRRSLADREVADLVLLEATEREDAAHGYEVAGRVERAERLRAEAGVIRSFLG